MGLAGLLTVLSSASHAQTEPLIPARVARVIDPETHQPSIYFPQAPLPAGWRKSLGLVFTATPPEITEEVRVAIPAIDFNLQRGLSKHWYLAGRVQTQLVQSNVSLGPRWARSLTDRLYVGAGIDGVGWFGALAIKNVFNSQAYGFQTIPNLALGYRLTRDLQLTVRTEAIMDLYYRSTVGTLAVENNNRRFNGVAFAFVLEQPFYRQQHVTLGLRASYANFNWQFWSLYDTFDRNFFYPQVFFAFIL